MLISIILVSTVSMLVPFGTSIMMMNDTDMGWDVTEGDFIGYRVETSYFLFSTVNYLGFNVTSNTTDSGVYTLTMDGLQWNIGSNELYVESAIELSYSYGSGVYSHTFGVSSYFPLYPIIIVPKNYTEGGYDLNNIGNIYDDGGLWDGFSSDSSTLNFTNSVDGSYCNMIFDTYGVLDSAIVSVMISGIEYAQTYTRITDSNLLNTIDDTSFDGDNGHIYKYSLFTIPLAYYAYNMSYVVDMQNGFGDGITCFNPMRKAMGVEYIWNFTSESWDSNVNPWEGDGDNYAMVISNDNFNSFIMRGDYHGSCIVDAVDGNDVSLILNDEFGDDGDLVGYRLVMNSSFEGIIYSHINENGTMKLGVLFGYFPYGVGSGAEGSCDILQSDENMKLIHTLYKIGTSGTDLYFEYHGMARYFGVYDDVCEIGSNYVLFGNTFSGESMYIEVGSDGWLVEATIRGSFGSSGIIPISFTQMSQEEFDNRDDPAYNVRWGIDVGDALYYNVSRSSNPDYEGTFSKYVINSKGVQNIKAFGDMDIKAAIVNATHYKWETGIGWNATGDQWSEDDDSDVIIGSQRTDFVLYMRNGPTNLVYGLNTTADLIWEIAGPMLSSFADINEYEGGDNWIHIYNSTEGNDHYLNITWNDDGVVTLLDYDFMANENEIYARLELMETYPIVPKITKEYIEVYGFFVIFNFTVVSQDGFNGGNITFGDGSNIDIYFPGSYDINLNYNDDGSLTIVGMYLYESAQSYQIKISIKDSDDQIGEYSEVIETFNLVNSFVWSSQIGDYLVYNITNGTESWYSRYEVMNEVHGSLLDVSMLGLNAIHYKWIDEVGWVLMPDYLLGNYEYSRIISGGSLGMMYVGFIILSIPQGFTGYDYVAIWSMILKVNTGTSDIIIHSCTDTSYNITLMGIINMYYEWNEKGIVTYLYLSDPSFAIEMKYIDVPKVLASENINYEVGNINNFINWTVIPVHVFGDNATYEVLLNGESYIELTNLTEDGIILINVDGLEVGNYTYTIIVYDGSGRVVQSSIVVIVNEKYIPPPPSEGLELWQQILIVIGSTGGASIAVYFGVRNAAGLNVKRMKIPRVNAKIDVNYCKFNPSDPRCKNIKL